MRTKTLGLLRTVALGFLLAMLAMPVFANSTAKAALNEVQAAGKKWQGDAVLTHVSTMTAKADGKASSWLYTFYSPKAKKSAIITAIDTKVDVDEVMRNTSVDPLTIDFLDSDKVMDAAAKAGLKFGADDILLGLTTFGQATGKPKVYWTVTVMSDSKMSSVTLDPKNGALIKRDDVKL
jgi:lipoprotein-anchoring transpeptidase ErfK/SrfK